MWTGYNSDYAPQHTRDCKEQGLWLAISQRGGLAINQHVYLGECIKTRLEPMIKEYYQDGNYIL
ncbi:hypothetical protein BpHYR1_004382 [Brachionus plicatilis]|uniref:Uncharacterized protein n=1 Tax=Brachionus plicatilis TaxID=10195 RepID=A0A3M7Q5J1_BRAPC|nr:hypothetical protein BpHYR1_004382 [Brachionus plicatilis]